MKKLLFVIVAMCMCVGLAQARDNYSRDASVLPAAAQSTIKTHCKGKVNLVKIDKTLGRVDEYEVILTDGTEIDFDRNGNWTSVEVGANASVPSGFVPEGVANYVKQNHKGQRIVGIDRERRGYEVELSNGIEMKFDNDGKFLRYDD